MERWIVSALFYGAMALVALTCGVEMLHFWKAADSGWASAYGSWFGGAGSFAAAAGALWIADRQNRAQIKTAAEERQKRSKLLYFKINRYCTNIGVAMGSITRDSFGALVEAEMFRDNKQFVKGIFNPDPLSAAQLSDTELAFVDDVSLGLVDLYEWIRLYQIALAQYVGNSDEDARDNAFDRMMSCAEQIRRLAISISKGIRADHLKAKSIAPQA